MVTREEELRQKAEAFARRAAAATNEEERVQLLTVAQEYQELGDEWEARGPPPLRDTCSKRWGVMAVAVPTRESLLNALLGLLTGFFLLAAMPRTALAADPEGVWLTEDKDAALTITKCDGQLCGRIIWLESATNRSGSLRLDEHNPDPAKQTQRICGLVVITGLKPSGPDTWDGYVYNPQDGKTYSGNITVLSDETLRLRAYIGLPIFGKSQTWTRVNSAAANNIEYNCRSHG